MFLLTTVGMTLGQKEPSAITGLTIGGGSSGNCPVLVIGVWPGSPAEKAGMKVGDALSAIDDKPVKRFDEAVRLLHADEDRPVSLSFERRGATDSKTVGREKMAVLLEASRQKMVNGVIVPLDFTEAEMQGKMTSLTIDRIADRAFASHYPTDEKLYYGGFEVLRLKNPAQVVVLGIEDGPASRSGVHWGDTVLAVNGIDPRDKTVAELEKIFSSDKPSKMTLKIDRSGVAKTYVFDLQQAAQVLRDNGNRLVHGVPVPIGVPEKYLPCFVETFPY